MLEQPWFVAVRGNHEQMALDAVDDNEMMLWPLNGGTWLNEIPPEERKEVKSQLEDCH